MPIHYHIYDNELATVLQFIGNSMTISWQPYDNLLASIWQSIGNRM